MYELWLAIFIIVPLRESPAGRLGIYTARQVRRRQRPRPGDVIIILLRAPKILTRAPPLIPLLPLLGQAPVCMHAPP